MPERITSLQNPRIKNLVRLQERSHRRRQKRFVIEGLREIQRALQVGWPVEALFFCDDLFREAEAFSLLESAEARGVELVALSADAFRKCAYRENPDGLLAIAVERESGLSDLPQRDPALFIVLEGIEKPGNLGAIIRTANAASVDGIILLNSVTDPFNPNAIRSSQGAVFDLPIASCDSAQLRDFLARRFIQLCVLTPEAPALLWQADLRQPLALLFGAEDKGVSNQWLQPDTLTTRLPMHGVSDSLNLAATVAIATFEALRQRTS